MSKMYLGQNNQIASINKLKDLSDVQLSFLKGAKSKIYTHITILVWCLIEFIKSAKSKIYTVHTQVNITRLARCLIEFSKKCEIQNIHTQVNIKQNLPGV